MEMTPEVKQGRQAVHERATDLALAVTQGVEDLTPYWLALEEAFWEMAEKIEDDDPNVEEARKEIQEK